MNDDIVTRYRVLIVDDEPTNLKILANILQDNYDVSAATSGEDALQIAEQMKPDIILLDLIMPDMNGIEVCEALKAKESTSNIPVIFVTSMSDKVNEIVGFKAGAADYISKPVVPLIVTARVKIHLQNHIYVQFLERLLEQRTQDMETAQQEAKLLLQLDY